MKDLTALKQRLNDIDHNIGELYASSDKNTDCICSTIEYLTDYLRDLTDAIIELQKKL